MVHAQPLCLHQSRCVLFLSLAPAGRHLPRHPGGHRCVRPARGFPKAPRMRYYIIAGEASGDMHAANLMEQIRRLDPEARFRCWGGDRMKAQGAELVKHYRELAFMGFTEVVMNLRTILRNIRFCKEDLEQWRPDAVVLVDYPGFNLRIAAFAKEKGFRVYYYISPQVWAWKASRVHKIRETVDRMLVILPFEKEFYARYGYEVDFVG